MNVQHASNRPSRLLAAAIAPLMAVAGLAATGAAAAAPAATPANQTTSPFCAPAAPGHRACLGLALKQSARRHAPTRPGARPQVGAGPAGGYVPQDIQAAYGLTGMVATHGAGQTVAIVDAFSDPKAAPDLSNYRFYFSLPGCSVASGCLRIDDLSHGAVDSSGGWEQEESLDLDAVSMSCPLCHILLVEARDNSDASLIAAVQAASALHPSVISLSFGGCETDGSFDSALHAANVPITVATGDNAYFYSSTYCAVGTPEYPASSPYVTAVGGTSLMPSGTTRGWSETAWSYSNNGVDDLGGGSGCSGFEPKPAWQTDSGCGMRTVADVSADADPNTGVSAYDSFTNGGGWGEYGGTSLGAPLIAGIDALASPVAAPDARTWYATTHLNDITSGSNAPSPADCSSAYLCNAGVGYDGPTGVGTPSGLPTVDPTVTALATPVHSTAIPLSWAAPAFLHPSSYQVWEQDNTSGTGRWLPWASTGATSTTLYGFRDHTYGFAVQYFMANGATNGAPSVAAASTTVAPDAVMATPFTSMYALDGHGNLHPASSPPLVGIGWTWDIARGLAASPTGEGGVVLDGWGGIHAVGDSPATHASPGAYWSGWDIATGIAVLPGQPSASGYVLDGFGGLHPFSTGAVALPRAVSGNAYWAGWRIARGVATFSDGAGGLVLDGWGGVHPFAVTPHVQPTRAVTTGYWANWDIARGIVLLPGSTAAVYRGYVLDGWGGVHGFASAGTSLPPTVASTGFYWPGWDIARSIVMVPNSSTGGYVIDGYGGFHPFGSAPAVSTPAYASAPLIRAAAAG